MNQQAYNLLGLMMRSRRIDIGATKILEGIKRGKYHLVILAEDASELTQEQFRKQAAKTNVKVIVFGTKQTIAESIGKDVTVAIGIIDKGFADKMRSILEKKIMIEGDSCHGEN
ncbi:50S ribosomal protein L7ae [Erysipelotrichaceae bacterium]|nr:50S ribosomal protein L7ae [Erysipelotrichaceae bacterium]